MGKTVLLLTVIRFVTPVPIVFCGAAVLDVEPSLRNAKAMQLRIVTPVCPMKIVEKHGLNAMQHVLWVTVQTICVAG